MVFKQDIQWKRRLLWAQAALKFSFEYSTTSGTRVKAMTEEFYI